jgi:hypothetical protein
MHEMRNHRRRCDAELAGAHQDMNNAKAREVGLKVRAARAVSRALDLAPTIKELQESGVTTLRGIAAALNERGIPTSRGKGRWQASQVRRLMARLRA